MSLICEVCRQTAYHIVAEFNYMSTSCMPSSERGLQDLEHYACSEHYRLVEYKYQLKYQSDAEEARIDSSIFTWPRYEYDPLVQLVGDNCLKSSTVSVRI